MNVLLLTIYLYIGWKFGNWKDFDRLYPTLLFLIIGDLLYQFLLFNHPMWTFQPVGEVDQWLGLNHTLIVLGRMAIQYPVTIAVFLGRMGSNKRNQLFSIILWSGIYIITQFAFHVLNGLIYHNGWNFLWDCAFTVMLFSMVLFHYKRPLYAWIIAFLIVLTLWWIFEVPFSVLK